MAPKPQSRRGIEGWGRGEEERSDGAVTPGSDPGFDANWLYPQGRAFALWALIFSSGHSERMTTQAPPR